VDTLPSLTDTSAAGDFEELDESGFPATTAGPLGIYAPKHKVVDGDTPSVQDPTQG
jgi:hypothetical protein